jgi:hypothetical protein
MGIAPPEHPGWTLGPRNPMHLALGEFRDNAEQPVWFSDSKVFLDHQDEGPLRTFGVGAIGNYGSFTSINNNDVFWYQDRYTFLLGKKITREFLSDLNVQE